MSVAAANLDPQSFECPMLRGMNHRDDIPSAWRLAIVFTSIGCALLVFMIWALVFVNAPLPVRLCTLIGLFPIAYFLLLGWAATYFAITGHRHPLTYRIDKQIGRATVFFTRDIHSRSKPRSRGR
jgi:hypothetical protein